MADNPYQTNNPYANRGADQGRYASASASNNNSESESIKYHKEEQLKYALAELCNSVSDKISNDISIKKLDLKHTSAVLDFYNKKYQSNIFFTGFLLIFFNIFVSLFAPIFSIFLSSLLIITIIINHPKNFFWFQTRSIKTSKKVKNIVYNFVFPSTLSVSKLLKLHTIFLIFALIFAIYLKLDLFLEVQNLEIYNLLIKAHLDFNNILVTVFNMIHIFVLMLLKMSEIASDE